MKPLALDHIAFWVADRRPMVERCERYLGMHVIDEQDGFTLVGADARHGKLTFFDAAGPRSPGVLSHVGLRVSNLAAAQRRLPASPDQLELGEGLRVRLVERQTDVEFDLDHVAFVTPDAERTASELERYGFRRASLGSVEVGDARLVIENGEPGGTVPDGTVPDGTVPDGTVPDGTGAPLLNHLGLLVESAEAHRAEAEELGLEVESVVDAPNTLAVFLTGPDGIRIEYVEHKSTFALA